MLKSGSYLLENYSPEKFRQTIKRLLPQPRLSHPNLLLIEAENAIKISQIREIRHFLALKSWQGGRRVVAIAEGNKMTVPAQNALLKILEEPGPQTIILIQTDNCQQLLPTIRSRCQLLRQTPRQQSLGEWENFLRQLASASPKDRLRLLNQAQKKMAAAALLDRLLQAGQQRLYRAPAARMPLLQKQTKTILIGRQMLMANLKPQDAFDWLAMNL